MSFSHETARDQEIPFSRSRSRWRVGGDYLERSKLADPASPPPTGLFDSFSDFAGPNFDPAIIDPAVEDFYLNTTAYHLQTLAMPRPLMSPLIRLFLLLAATIRQTQFPVGVALDDMEVASRMVAIDPVRDNREGARGWVRTYSRRGRTAVLYTAIYSTHKDRSGRYLNIAFPFPGANLTSILRFRNIDGAGAELTTDQVIGRKRSTPGVYWVTRKWALRLPMTESIKVWPVGAIDIPDRLALLANNAKIVAEHRLFLCGRRYMTLLYLATPKT